MKLWIAMSLTFLPLAVLATIIAVFGDTLSRQALENVWGVCAAVSAVAYIWGAVQVYGG